MTDFDPGVGWREASLNDLARDEPNCLVLYGGGLKPDRVWYPSARLLPTAEGTVIRVLASSNEDLIGVLLHLDLTDGKYPWVGGADAYRAALIQDFETVAEPTPRVALYEEQQRVRRDVIANVRKIHIGSDDGRVNLLAGLDALARRYGVES